MSIENHILLHSSINNYMIVAELKKKKKNLDKHTQFWFI